VQETGPGNAFWNAAGSLDEHIYYTASTSTTEASQGPSGREVPISIFTSLTSHHHSRNSQASISERRKFCFWYYYLTIRDWLVLAAPTPSSRDKP